MNGGSALLMAGLLLVDDHLRGQVLRRIRPQHPNNAGCPSHHLYFTWLHFKMQPVDFKTVDAPVSQSFPEVVGEGFCGPGGSRCKFQSSNNFLSFNLSSSHLPSKNTCI